MSMLLKLVWLERLMARPLGEHRDLKLRVKHQGTIVASGHKGRHTYRRHSPVKFLVSMRSLVCVLNSSWMCKRRLVLVFMLITMGIQVQH
jgi:hypothetical protein